MKRLLLVYIPVLLFSQSLDSLKVNILDPKGGPVQGIERGFSKLIVNTGITDLEFDPVFTVANSEHFKIKKTASGFDIIVNVKKLEKKPGFYSDLKFALIHPKFVTYNMSMSVNPGRSYEIAVNPSKSSIIDPALLQLLNDTKIQIDNGFYDNSRVSLSKVNSNFKDNLSFKALNLFLDYKEGKANQVGVLRAMKEMLNLNIDFNFKQDIILAADDIEILLYSDLRNMNKNQRFEDAFAQSNAYLEFATNAFPYFDRITELNKQAKKEIAIKTDGVFKTVKISVPVKPAGLQLIINGENRTDVKRSQGPNGIEYLTFNYNYQVFSKSKLQQIKWSLIDPNEKFESVSFQDYDDNLNEWFVSYNTTAEKAITNVIVLAEADRMNWTWYAVGAGAIAAAVVLSGGSDDNPAPAPLVEIADPKNPNGKFTSKKHYQLKLGVSF